MHAGHADRLWAWAGLQVGAGVVWCGALLMACPQACMRLRREKHQHLEPAVLCLPATRRVCPALRCADLACLCAGPAADAGRACDAGLRHGRAAGGAALAGQLPGACAPRATRHARGLSVERGEEMPPPAIGRRAGREQREIMPMLLPCGLVPSSLCSTSACRVALQPSCHLVKHAHAHAHALPCLPAGRGLPGMACAQSFTEVLYEPGLALIVDVRLVVPSTGTSAPAGWTALPLFEREGPYVASGYYHLPLFQGVPSRWATATRMRTHACVHAPGLPPPKHTQRSPHRHHHHTLTCTPAPRFMRCLHGACRVLAGIAQSVRWHACRHARGGARVLQHRLR